MHPVITAPLFFAIPFGLTRRRGDRLIGGIGLYACYLSLIAVLFGSLKLANTVILSLLYGPRAVVSGAIQIVGGRHAIELSNGVRYGGIAYALWMLADFLTLGAVGAGVWRMSRWLFNHSPLLRKMGARVSKAFEDKKSDR